MPLSGATIKTSSPPAAGLVDRADGPALLLQGDDSVAAVNSDGAMLAEALAAGNHDLRGLVLGAAASAAPAHGRIVLRDADNAISSYEICATPLLPGDEILITARDVSYEANLTSALLKSRDLYKDLMHCSADFGWETDASGAFSYVSPGGALGYDARDMNGRRAQALFGLSPEDAARCFAARLPQRLLHARGRDRAGQRVILSVSAVPVTDRAGHWRGARGVARDITEEHDRAAALKLDQARQSLLARIVLDMRSDTAPDQVVGRTVDSAARALRARAGWALSLAAPDGIVVGCDSATEDNTAGPLTELAARGLDRPGHDRHEDAFVEIGFDGTRSLLAVAGDADRLSAALVFDRDSDREPWRQHEVELVHGIAGHLAAALKQADIMRRLEYQSRTDELTGLLNRRALFQEIARRQSHQARSGRPACFLYIDMDHFKHINDTLGHAAGDATLARMGGILSDMSRAGDLAGRIGGDEFGLWLEDTPPEGGIVKAEWLLAQSAALRAAAGDPESPLSMSIGIALSRPGQEDGAQSLADRADQALYGAKRSGRGQVVMETRNTGERLP